VGSRVFGGVMRMLGVLGVLIDDRRRFFEARLA
jgi:hypothetical protein